MMKSGDRHAPLTLKASPFVLTLLKNTPTEAKQQVTEQENLLGLLGLSGEEVAELKSNLCDTILQGMGLKGPTGRDNIMQLVHSFCEINEWTMGGSEQQDSEPVGSLLLCGGRGLWGEPAPPRLSLAIRDVIARRLEVAISLARSMASPDEQGEILNRLTSSVVEHLNNALDRNRVPSLLELSVRALIESECAETARLMRETAQTITEIQQELTQLRHEGAHGSTEHIMEPPPAVEAIGVEELASQLPPEFRQLVERSNVDGAKLWTLLQGEIAENHSDITFQRQIQATQSIQRLERTLEELDRQREREWDEALFRYRVCPTEDEVVALNRFRLWLHEVEPEKLCGATGELVPPNCPICGGHTIESAYHSMRESAEHHDGKFVGFRCPNAECVTSWITCEPGFISLASLPSCHNTSEGCTTLFLREEWATRCKTCNVPWCAACLQAPEVSRRYFCKSCHHGPFCSRQELQQLICSGRAATSLGSFNPEGTIRRCAGCRLRCCEQCWGSYGMSCAECEDQMHAEAEVRLARRYGQVLDHSDSDADGTSGTDSGFDTFSDDA